MLRALLSVIALFLFGCAAQAAAERVALVIGNGEYIHQAPLANPQNDVAAMVETLEAVGYEVTKLENLDEDGMERALADFSEQADKADVALVYYSGHGMEIAETNYLIPIDAELKKERDAKFEAVDLDYVRAAIEGARKLKVVILDACRDNTFLSRTRGGTRGMKRVVAQAGEVIAYSTAPGSVAQDGEPGGLSPYTRALSEKLRESPDMDVRFLFTSLGAKTAEYAGVQQRPYTEFASIMPDGRLPLGVGDGAAPEAPADSAFDKAITNRNLKSLSELVEDFPNHPRAGEAMRIVQEEAAKAMDRRVAAALRGNNREALRKVALAAPGHARADEVREALNLHNRIDDAVAGLDLPALDEVYFGTNERHPRRRDIRDAIRSAIINDACGRFIKYRMACPPQLFAIDTPEEPAPADVAKAPVEEPKPEPPKDPLAAFLGDVSDASLERTVSVKVEWRQTALKALGHYRGAIDGAAGPGMARGVAAWRKALGVERSGPLTNREVVALMKQGAERDAATEAYLGVMYGIGLGVDLSPARSRELLSAARDRGVADAGVYLKNLSANWKE